MTSYISFDNAIQFLVAAYLASVFGMMAISQFCLAVIETSEELGK